jgi:hypothetical protein
MIKGFGKRLADDIPSNLRERKMRMIKTFLKFTLIIIRSQIVTYYEVGLLARFFLGA